MAGSRTAAHCRDLLRRRVGLDSNPVRRASDRAEAWLRIGLAVLFLAGAPALGFGLAHRTAAGLASQARAETAREYLVPATLLGGSRQAPRIARSWTGHEWAPARWTAPDGTVRTGRVYARASDPPGSTVRIWTTRTGHMTRPPLARSEIASRTVAAGLVGALGLGLVLLTVGILARWLLDRRRLAAWDADWRLVEPHWTRRLR
jgi:hypothetical protein